MTLGTAIKFWLSIGCFTQEYMENITVALRFFEEYSCKALYTCIFIKIKILINRKLQNIAITKIMAVYIITSHISVLLLYCVFTHYSGRIVYCRLLVTSDVPF